MYALLIAVGQQPPDFGELRGIARRDHPTGATIPPDIYGLRLEALLQTIAECDEEYTEEIGNVRWKTVAPAVEHILSHWCTRGA